MVVVVPAHLGSHGKGAVKRVCVCVCCSATDYNNQKCCAICSDFVVTKTMRETDRFRH